jgi:ketosteroid isomerase-like protein
MSQENVDLMRRVFEKASGRAGPTAGALDALDADSMTVIFKTLDPEIEFHEDPRFPEAGVYRGIEAVRDYWDRFGESFDEFSFEAEDVVDLEEARVLVLLRLRTRGRDSGATAESRVGWIYTIRDGLTVRIDAFLDRDDAVEAAGLRE